jgi:transcription initiation factor IIE alpha subunit
MNARYCSLWRILGAAYITREVRRGFEVYKIVKFLAENPESKFTETEICEELKMDKVSASRILNSLGKAGVIDYFSPCREVEGKWQRRWAKYKLVKELDDTKK